MIEKIVTSKTRAKLLRLFLTNIDNRYYLRELERMLDESLSPMRRQLMKLVKMGILVTEYEANLKYYRLNKNFSGIGELRRLVLGIKEESPKEIYPSPQPSPQKGEGVREETLARHDGSPTPIMPMRYDVAVLGMISIFVLLAAIFVLYTSNRNITEVANLVSAAKAPLTPALSPKGRGSVSGEMASKQWKLLPGGVPVLSSGATGGEKRSSEL